jgi:hypothetical protein
MYMNVYFLYKCIFFQIYDLFCVDQMTINSHTLLEAEKRRDLENKQKEIAQGLRELATMTSPADRAYQLLKLNGGTGWSRFY